MLAALQSGEWLTLQRIRAYSIILLLGYVLGVAGWFATSKDGRDWQKQQPGADFAQVYAAGTLVRDGLFATPYDLNAHVARQRQLYGADSAVFSWNYPPYFLAIAGVLALLPYLVALAVWQFGTMAAYLASIRGFIRAPEALLAAAAFPAAFVNLGHGQTGFLIAATLAGGLALTPSAPLLAGALFGLVALKPQYGLLIPVALAFGGYWRAFVAAGVMVAAMTAAAAAGFGVETWTAFFESLPASRQVGLEYSNTGFFKMQSLFAATRMLGGLVPLAYALHGGLALGVVAAVALIWRGVADYRLKSSALMTGAMLVTPYAFDYDMVLLGPAIACMVAHGLERGFVAWEKSLLTLAFAAPLLARPTAMATHLPLGLLSMIAFFALIAIRSGLPETFAARARTRERRPA